MTNGPQADVPVAAVDAHGGVGFRRRRPSPAALRWVEAQLEPGSQVVSWRRLTGGLGSAVHRVTVERLGRRRSLVLRQYEASDSSSLVEREARVLDALHETDVPAPVLVASTADGADAGGHPSLLMTRVAGHVHLTPNDPDGWVRQMAAAAAALHELDLQLPPFERWFDLERARVPATATEPQLWRRAFDLLREPPPPVATSFVHRDFQHFNLLWSRERLTGVVDWTSAARGPREVDVGHCRLNLVVLFDPDVAERFRLAYEGVAGRAIHPWWDLLGVASYDDAWPRFIPVQVAGRTTVSTDDMTPRVEELLRRILARL